MTFSKRLTGRKNTPILRLAPGVLFLASALLPARPAQAQELWRTAELLASEDFSGGLENWLAEGDVEARIEDGRLRFESTEKTEVKKGNIWWKKAFRGPVQIEFDYRSLTPYGLSMFWWNAWGRNDEDLLSFSRSGVYDEYVKGGMNGYHISFHRFESGVSNLRKSYGFHMLASSRDPVPLDNLEMHHITIYSRGNHLRFLVDGRLVHDYIDRGEPCLEPGSWAHEKPCPGTGPFLDHGLIGVRHTNKQVAYYDNFKVYRLAAP